MSTSKDLRELVAGLLVDAGVGTYRASGKYLASDTSPIYFSRMQSSPDRLLVVTVYPRAEDHAHGVQVRCRGAAGGTVSAEDLADSVRSALHGLTDLHRGSTDVELLHVVSVARMGVDAGGRDEVAVNLRAVTSDPSTSLID